jgi:hypothetical protein
MAARLRRRILRTPQQLAELVVGGIVRHLGSRAVVQPMGAAVAQVPSPGQAEAITAQAGVAAFHQPPSWTWLPKPRAAGHALPDECRSVEIPCRT